MAKEELLEMQGVVTEVLPDARYLVTLENITFRHIETRGPAPAPRPMNRPKKH